MQNEFPLTIPQWIIESVKSVAWAGAGALILRFITLYQNRRKPAAETAEITIRARVTEGDAVSRWMLRLEDAQSSIDRVRKERDAWQDQYDKVFTERDELLRQNSLLQKEIGSYESQLTTMRATLKMNRLNYDNTQDAKLLKPEQT